VRNGPAGLPSTRSELTSRYWSGMRRVARLVPGGVDVINAHEWPALRAGRLAARRLGVPLVWTRNDETIFERAVAPEAFHLGDTRLPRRALNAMLGIPDLRDGRRADAVVVHNRRQALLVERSYGRSADELALGPASRFFDAPQPAEARRRLGVPEAVHLAVGAAILLPHRRFEDLIEAVALVDDSPRVEALLVGSDHVDPAYADRLTALIEARGLESRVRLTRRNVTEDELLDAYAGGDVFVFPNQHQSWGLAPLEALAARTPVIVSTGAGVADVLAGRPGVLAVPPEDPVRLAEAIRASRSGDLRGELEPTRSWIRDELSMDRYADRMLDVFRRLGVEPHEEALA
jgi:glycosyltransferase involved in cell wall biosynthesis